MITEDYVSFETAKLLKEKGFNEDCYTCYLIDEIQHYDYKSRNWDLIEGVISAPTLQMAMKWLREVHNLYIQTAVTLWPQKGYFVHICMYNDRYNNFKDLSYAYVEFMQSYEQACESAIRYCLENLI